MQNDRETALKYFDENYKLIFFTLNRFYPNNANDEDYQQNAAIGLWKACLYYDPEKSTFSSYAVNSIKNEIADTIRRASFQCRNPKDNLVCLEHGDWIPEIETRLVWAKRPKEILTARQLEILILTSQGMSVRKIGEIIGVSRTIVSIEQRKIKQIIKDNISEI